MRNFNGVTDDYVSRQDEMEPVQFDFTENWIEDIVVLSPKGSLNTATVSLFRDQLYNLSRDEGCKIVMSCSNVESIDSVGLGVMIAAHKKADDYGGKIVFCDLSDFIFKNMKMLHMDKYLNFSPNVDSALGDFNW
ncbi:STAS domain-containing protein [Maridesulfovibrio salexigens]|uniref:Anti-sigma factor antagonist n=1 Tax=Maridesulfovibrio salexigens (strain ATCC 14822 / DSM 2638 / NCIMB 8403 / VKM B-1763) TaxID=526222 RepID=C6BSA0_MARSD|nr:STAS domain-containing protein [Maridesulfovibrio salexigens]ACS79576.1 anti-sigma-factor antagonist [Maridesulfovibrio salexigens DSM 2638]